MAKTCCTKSSLSGYSSYISILKDIFSLVCKMELVLPADWMPSRTTKPMWCICDSPLYSTLQSNYSFKSFLRGIGHISPFSSFLLVRQIENDFRNWAQPQSHPFAVSRFNFKLLPLPSWFSQAPATTSHSSQTWQTLLSRWLLMDEDTETSKLAKGTSLTEENGAHSTALVKSKAYLTTLPLSQWEQKGGLWVKAKGNHDFYTSNYNLN